ncbi:hypothetical protein B0H14DRAFT_2576657 [Mycena olivaceomarginata]|nr:hypothetical protein B0H14DRAFT_2576657 [Mycena olivaceomarginata]
MRLTASALTVLFAFFALTSSVLAQSDAVVGREVDSDSNDYPKHKHKPHKPNPPRPPPCNPCGRPPVCAKGRKCVDRRICPAQGNTNIVCPLDNARRGEDGYGDGGHDGKGGNKGILPGDDKGPGGHHGGKPPGPGKGDGGDHGGKPSKPGNGHGGGEGQ